jgi:hypothetical protein
LAPETAAIGAKSNISLAIGPFFRESTSTGFCLAVKVIASALFGKQPRAAVVAIAADVAILARNFIEDAP